MIILLNCTAPRACLFNEMWYQNPEEKKWHRGVIRDQLNERSYTIEGENGGVYRRNRIHLRPKTTPFKRNIIDDDKSFDDSDEMPQPTTEAETPVSTSTQNSDHSNNAQQKSENTRLSSPDTLQTNNYITRYGRKIKPNPKYT